MKMFETLLANILFLLFGMFIYLLLIEYKKTKMGNQALLVIVAAIILMLCMTFPIPIGNGFIFDLRYIPFIIASLYSGFFVAIPLYLVLNIYRFIIGGPGFMPSLLLSSLALVTIPFLHTSFLALKSIKKVIFATVLAFLHVFFYLSSLSFFFSSLTREFYQTAALVTALQTFGTGFVMTLLVFFLNAREKPS
ncbi:LytS/YhcK type 5TM receptor domain-containing protein [Alkalihalophilus lindianensis]|uniref:LytS/YhcK type 5TM receptor domain-containing protein n=1 Tax=Alkalihalophilus lindianensis TaxID=1630542 RepID=A0ABU3XDN0_9BACI|nr:LytS/YhcK type 5TM receptor domain-containing protein [Alkalihalophilus lindianensis]MDV2685985.1 LytS/YhcK type 5TM receptor domain-containing protein [Alkalihalophilus lindianensis]